MTEKLLNYFNGDELAANVWQSKYAQEGEVTPDDMHKRLAKEFARIERNYQITEPLKNSDLKQYQTNVYKKRVLHGLMSHPPLDSVSVVNV